MKLRYLPPQMNTVGLVAHYKLQHSPMNSAEVFDYSLGGFEGALLGTDIAPAYPGFTFNGTDDFIGIVSGPASVNTVLLWINQADIAAIETPFAISNTDFLTVETGTLTKNGFAGGTTVLYVDGVVATTVTASTWHLIGITDTVAKDGSSGQMAIGRKFFPPAFFEGLIGETFLFDRVLSLADVKSIYELTRWRYSV